MELVKGATTTQLLTLASSFLNYQEILSAYQILLSATRTKQSSKADDLETYCYKYAIYLFIQLWNYFLHIDMDIDRYTDIDMCAYIDIDIYIDYID